MKPIQQKAAIPRCLTMLLWSVVLAANWGCDSTDRAEQRQTMRTLSLFGTDWMEASGWQKIPRPEMPAELSEDSDYSKYMASFDHPSIARIDLETIRQLLPEVTLEKIPVDGWGRAIEVWTSERGSERRVMLRSLGRDGIAESEIPSEEWDQRHRPHPFSEADRDIIWVQGYFLTYPNEISDSIQIPDEF